MHSLVRNSRSAHASVLAMGISATLLFFMLSTSSPTKRKQLAIADLPHPTPQSVNEVVGEYSSAWVLHAWGTEKARYGPAKLAIAGH